ncbi:MAG TPA: minichromosome maintenance protein MCM [Candidatus Altiarchaeales archaeon]|nr:minichromosome maintenance protein MCM [Candidatus Altiarchaeales archaeon]
MSEFREIIKKFLKRKKKEIARIGELYPERKSLFINYEELENFSWDLAEELISNPDEIIPLFQDVLKEEVILRPEFSDDPRLYVRFFNLPKERGYTLAIRDITSDYVGRLIAVEGVITKATDVLPKVRVAKFICNRCSREYDEPQDTRSLVAPPLCISCRKKDFRFIAEESKWIDVQRMEIQEPLELLRGGEQARRIELWLEDDIVDKAQPGDRVMITGIVRLLPQKKGGAIYHKFIEVNNIEKLEKEFEEVEISEEEEEEIIKLSRDPRLYEKIINSIAPGIYGYREVKEAIALQLFGGTPGKVLPDGTRLRSDIHILLIGDPGVAKSRILQYVNQIAPKSIYVTGKGTTGAGLTATAEKDEFAEGGWTLKAGALVLAGGGIACIDEFDKMDKDERSAMHEAMEQQTISVAKAGIVAKFLANTAILAAANPKYSRFDSYKPLAEQFDIPPTLLSRFDLIFPIRDVLDKERDAEIAEHILKIHSCQKAEDEVKPEIDVDLLRKYISYARKNIKPTLSKEAMEKIKNFYVELRAGSKETVQATPRQLEALIRLSEASAKMRLSNVVTVDDAERAIALTKFVLREIAYDETTGRFDIDRIATEYPKSLRDKLRMVEDILHELIASSADGMADHKDVIEMAREKGLEKLEVERIIAELKSKGTIYEPKHGKYMFTEEY